MKITNVFTGDSKGQADLLIAASFEHPKQPSFNLSLIDGEASEISKQAFSSGRFLGSEGSVFSSFNTGLKLAKEFVLIGLGKNEKWGRENLRKSISSVVCIAKSRRAKTVRILAESFLAAPIQLDLLSEILPEILKLSRYQFDKYLTPKKEDEKTELSSIEILYSKKAKKPALDKALHRAHVISDAVCFTRTLINEPANQMPPREMARHAKEIAQKGNLHCEVLGVSEMKKLKMGGIIGVSQGSKEAPHLIILEYGSQYKNHGTLCLIGKGVCFDTGGISIKPSANMEKMKYDMSGAAVVLGTLKAVSELKPALHIVGIAPCVENMPDGGAQRPGDIVKMHNGKSVEVINTDAEGRLILADALAYSERFKPTAIIDLATLTGACTVALSDKAIGLLGTDQNLIESVQKAGEKVGERCWQLPLWDEYFDQIKGHHSDILNVGTGGGGGTITAAMFLKQFVPIKRWAHLDIASTAWTDSNKPYRSRGATGIGVRLLLELIRNWK